ncbi:biotin transporter BioY [Cohnella zeiphila]|uniref:Biotin transporter n=1 Tax=Cohnella zeiphila TaxID=2761120 RepID=A0A7X0SLX9_9BACL|nr:biotin transporter BioY [Cohnella zeiphila]MBB6732376.1 biotin transporter BioY [Cohnella zeiphila]
MKSSLSQENTAELAPVRSRSARWIPGVVYVALFGALFVAFSYISIPLGFSPVPITLQTLGVMLAGGLLGAAYGFWSIAAVLLLTAIGLPLIHGSGGLAVLLGPTAGFLWAFPFAAWLIGWISDRLLRGTRRPSLPRQILLAVGIFAGGVILVYIGGVPWLAHKAHYSFAKALAQGCYPFLIGDTLKTIAATALIVGLKPHLPGFRSSSRQR